MKRILTSALCLVLVAAFALPAQVLAQQDNTNTDNTTETENPETLDQTQSSNESANTESGRKERIEAYKKKVTEKLTAAQERKITGACAGAQGKVNTHSKNVDKILTNRKVMYEKIISRLTTVKEKLAAASIDTVKLDTAILEVQTQSASIVAAIETYNATLIDLAEMDCTSDPSGFKAALTAAREQRADIIAKAKVLRSYITSDVKAILQELKAQLETSRTSQSDDTQADDSTRATDQTGGN